MKKLTLLLLLVYWVSLQSLWAQKDKKTEAKNETKEEKLLNSSTISALKFRSIGPAMASGRIADFAVNPNNHSEYYVAVASGNVWKTTNHGITWSPIFDNYGSYSIADVELDPRNSNVVWVATGEYNSQRVIGYGDGVYRSDDGGKTFKNMGLKNTEHIGRLAIDPRNSHVYVAAQGPLWGEGGERGLYKSTNNGETWEQILKIDENTGVTDILIDPCNPDVLYAASYQRRRHVFTLIDGGPGSAIYKSTDAGKTWNKLTNGLPSGDVGRIGLTLSPVNPANVFAIIELPEYKGGTYRSTDHGASWSKMSDYVSTSPQYYNRLFADPKDENRIFSVDTYSRYSSDGGKTWTNLALGDRHVDDHALWINPNDTEHLLIGGDGGIYESYDLGQTWRHIPNLPVTQFYRIAVDNTEPFYFIYGGTQDNNSMGGPSQSIDADGVTNADWFPTNGGDGFFSQIDPKNPNIVYAEAQYGYAVRYDKLSGETMQIKPAEPEGEAYRWNWNSPLIISPHSNTRLYFAANKLFRSDDRGNTWKVVSPDLSAQIDRNNLKVMGKVQFPDAVAKNGSTSLFGAIVSLNESPLKEGLLYVGTDDGLIQISENGGDSWTKYSSFAGVPEMTYVSCLLASQHNENVVYAAFDGRKLNNLKPMLFKSEDKGKTWKNLVANLPTNGSVYTIAEDFKEPNLLFVGTEFGIFFTNNGGKEWIQMKSGLPTIPVMDIKIQKRETDLVIATFGRGIYILENYSPLRLLSDENLKKNVFLFPVKDALIFNPRDSKYGQGADYFRAKNPSIGAKITFYFNEEIKTKREKRKDAEKKAEKDKVDIVYPKLNDLVAEDREEKPYLLLTITDSQGNVVNRLTADASKGIQQLNWDATYASTRPVGEIKKWDKPTYTSGIRVAPGTYSVSIAKVVEGIITDLGVKESFEIKQLNNTSLPAKDLKAVVAFNQSVAELSRKVMATSNEAFEYLQQIRKMRQALMQTPNATNEMHQTAKEIEQQLALIGEAFRGNQTLSTRQENQVPSIYDRLEVAAWANANSTSEVTTTQKEQVAIVEKLLAQQITALESILTQKFNPLKAKMLQLGAPYFGN